MSRRTKHITRLGFDAQCILNNLPIKGRIGGNEAKRLLEESCHANISLMKRFYALQNCVYEAYQLSTRNPV